MAHEHGDHVCYCPTCGYRQEVSEYVKCNTLSCPYDGTRMRAEDTGERRIARGVSSAVPIDNQPIDATFFGEARWLTDFITPDSLEVQTLYHHLTDGIPDTIGKITALWQWVASQVRYVKFVRGKIWINGKSAVQRDLWTLPETTIRTRVANCAVKSILLTSLIRNELPASQVYCALGNLYNGKPGGHAWVNLKLDDDYIVESTMPTAPAMVSSHLAIRYDPVHFFNDEQVLAIEGKTQQVPFTECYSTWLSDYLNWAYIQGGRR